MNQLPNMEIRNLKPVQIVGLFAMANQKDLSGIVPEHFYGMETCVRSLLADKVAFLQSLLSMLFGVDWDGKERLWSVLVEACRVECCLDRLEADLKCGDRRLRNACRVLVYDRSFPGKLPQTTVEMARYVVSHGGSEDRDPVGGSLQRGSGVVGLSGAQSHNETVDSQSRKVAAAVSGTP